MKRLMIIPLLFFALFGHAQATNTLHLDWNPAPDKVAQARNHWQHDLSVLLEQITVMPNNPHTVFNLAQTYECLQETASAQKLYEQRVAMPGNDEEKFIARCRLAKLYARQNNWPQALNQDLAAFSEQPHRAEPLVHIAEHYANPTDHALCYLFANQASDLPYPKDNALFVDQEVYDYVRYDLLSVSAWHLGNYKQGHNALRKALEKRPDNKHLLGNLALYVHKQKELSKKPQEPKVIQLQPNLPGISGVEQHLVMFNKMFYRHGIVSQVLTSKNAAFVVDKLKQPGNRYGLPCATYTHTDYLCRTGDIIEIDPTVLICNSIHQVEAGIKARQYIPLTLVYVNHNSRWQYSDEEIAVLNQVNGITTVHQAETEILQDLQRDKKLTVETIQQIPPFVDDEKFLSFVPQRSKQQFLAQSFGLTFTDNAPIICMIANFYWFKNHGLLLKALEILHYKKNKRFHALLAGHGPDLPGHRNTVHAMGLEDRIHFIGLTHQTPELLHHADMHVLTSYDESFGLVHVEAALMKKPFIGATTTGITPYIKQGVNGFMFENRNAEDLADKLEYLLDNPDQCKAMGEQAYQLACNELSAEATFTKWQKFLAAII